MHNATIFLGLCTKNSIKQQNLRIKPDNPMSWWAENPSIGDIFYLFFILMKLVIYLASELLTILVTQKSAKEEIVHSDCSVDIFTADIWFQAH